MKKKVGLARKRSSCAWQIEKIAERLRAVLLEKL